MAVDWAFSVVLAAVVGSFALVVAFFSAMTPMPYEEDDAEDNKRSLVKEFLKIPLLGITATSLCFAIVALQVMKDESVTAIHMLKAHTPGGSPVSSRADADYVIKLFTLGGHVSRVLKPDVVQNADGQRSCVKSWDTVLVVEHRSMNSFR